MTSDRCLMAIGVTSKQGGFYCELGFKFSHDAIFSIDHRLAEPLERTISNLRELADRMERHLTEKKSEEINRETKL